MKLIDSIKRHEGFVPKAYVDNKGILTIGYGTNIANGISDEEASLLLEYRLNKAISEVDTLFGGNTMNKLSDSQRDSLYELMYWIGYNKFIGFKKMIEAVKVLDFTKASYEMLDSRLGREYTTRTNKLARKLKGD